MAEPRRLVSSFPSNFFAALREWIDVQWSEGKAKFAFGGEPDRDLAATWSSALRPQREVGAVLFEVLA